MATKEHSGYPLKWFKDQDSARNSFECAVCLEILKDPVQVRDCGHQFCRLCINDILESDPRCPSCRIPISKTMIFQDHAANRLIRKLDVNCSNEGCSWLGNLSSFLEEHVNSCLFRSLGACSNNNLDVKKFEEQFESLNLEISVFKQEGYKYIYQRENNQKLIKEMKTKQLQHENVVKQFKSKHENDVKQLKSKHESEITKIKSKHQQDINNLSQQISKIRLMSNCSGTFTLKISDIINRLSQAKSSLGNEVNGEPFFSSHYGYKMKLLINLDEGGQGLTGYMGVYLILMKSDHDGILTWPFSKSCSFSVIDQQDDEGCRMDYTTVLIPEGQDSFKRPEQDENTGIGFSQFISHSHLRTRNYIKDNVVFIRVEV